MRIIFLLILPLFLSSCFQKEISASASDCGIMKTSHGQEVGWQSFPVMYYIEEDVPEEMIAPIKEAAGIWNKELGFTAVLFYPVKAKVLDKSIIQKNIIYWSKTSSIVGKNQAITLSFYDNYGKLDAAPIVINSVNFKYSFNELDENKVDMVSLMIHEFGHALGLDHSKETESVMGAVLPNAHLRQKISSLDKASVLCGVARSVRKDQTVAGN